jgi:hypothetical protein
MGKLNPNEKYLLIVKNVKMIWDIIYIRDIQIYMNKYVSLKNIHTKTNEHLDFLDIAIKYWFSNVLINKPNKIENKTISKFISLSNQ